MQNRWDTHSRTDLILSINNVFLKTRKNFRRAEAKFLKVLPSDSEVLGSSCNCLSSDSCSLVTLFSNSSYRKQIELINELFFEKNWRCLVPYKKWNWDNLRPGEQDWKFSDLKFLKRHFFQLWLQLAVWIRRLHPINQLSHILSWTTKLRKLLDLFSWT